MPTSVLLAVLAAAGLVALAPALTRRYDASERVAAERATTTARVIARRRRRRTVPGRDPVNPPRFIGTLWAAAMSAAPDSLSDPSRTRSSRDGASRGASRDGASRGASRDLPMIL